eukprot:gene2308-1445_t
MSTYPATDEACPHTWNDAQLHVPKFQEVVHRDECAYCCQQAHQKDGIYVCMTCFTGVCFAHISKHTEVCPEHVLYTRILELPSERPNVDMTKDVQSLCLVPSKAYVTDMCCASCKVRFQTDPVIPGLAAESYTAIINTPVPGAAPVSDGLNAFEPILCPHLLTLEQLSNPHGSTGPAPNAVCQEPGCTCTENCWMCVTCGYVGCPRVTSGGNNHALEHKNNTGHECCVKLGTITPTGADIYCYSCDDMVKDEYFDMHMNFFGIDIRTAKKTAKTMGELEYDYSSSFDFNKITEAGEDLQIVRGPGRTGIKNIGNSCYISSVVQCLFSMSPFRNAFYPNSTTPHQAACTRDPYKCHHCQMERMAEGLLSGKYCAPEGASAKSDDAGGVCPRLFKTVFAENHPEFSTGSQQDAQEYLLFLLEKLQQHVSVSPKKLNSVCKDVHPASLFTMKVETRVQCARCQKVRYSSEEDSCLPVSLPVPQEVMAAVSAQNANLAEELKSRPTYELQECLDTALAQGSVDCRCEACGQDTTYRTTMRLATFPTVLPIFIRRAYFDMATMSTKKFEAFVNVPPEIDLTPHRATGQKEGEVLMDCNHPSAQRLKTEAGAAAPKVDDMALATVLSMGFEAKAAAFALQRNDMDVEKTIEYLFSGVDVEAEMAAAAAAAAASRPKVYTDGSGKYRLFAMISHIGAAAKTGHYVCHIKEKTTGDWLLFNDEKVGISRSPPFALASLYFFERIAA